MRITDKYKQLNVQMHNEKPMYGVGGGFWAGAIWEFALKIGGRTCLDYGAGKQWLGKSALKRHMRVTSYDPCVEEISSCPEIKFDIVICTDVLEHIEPDCLVNVFADLDYYSEKGIFLAISTRKGEKIMADGRDNHLIVKSFEWWIDQFPCHWEFEKHGEDDEKFWGVIRKKQKPKKTVVCVLRAGGDFTTEYVRRLYDGIARNTARNFRFVCLCDVEFESELDFIETRTLSFDLPGWWAKMEMFKPSMADLGDFLYIDLDTIISGSMEPVFDVDEPTSLRDMLAPADDNLNCGSGLMFLTTKFRDIIWHKWREDPDQHMIAAARYGDQRFLRQWLRRWRRWQDVLPGLLISYKKGNAENLGSQGASMVIFHGRPRPHEIAWKIGIDYSSNFYWANTDGTKNITAGKTEWPEGFDVIGELQRMFAAGETISEFGCGYGRLVGAFEPSKYKGFDINQSAVDSARQKNPEFVFNQIDHPSDMGISKAILAYTVLLHISDEDITDCINSLCGLSERIVVAEILGKKWRPSIAAQGDVPVFNRDISEYSQLFNAAGFYLHYKIAHDYEHYPGAKITFLDFRRIGSD